MNYWLRFYLFVLGGFAVLPGCSTNSMTTQQCEEMDFYRVGQIDGSFGRHESYIKKHLKSCEGIREISQEKYLSGRAQGIQSYCSPEKAFELGRSGVDYYNTELCDSASDSALVKNNLEAYKKGWELFILNRQRKVVSESIAKRNDDIKKDKSVLNHISQALHVLNGESMTSELDREISSIDQRRNSLMAEAPVPKNSVNVRDTYGLRSFQSMFALAGGVGVGFGVGHAIQGQFLTQGWKWTLVDTASIGAIVASTRNSCREVAGPSQSLEVKMECNSALPVLSMAIFLVARVWQGISAYQSGGAPEYRDITKNQRNSKTSLGIGLSQAGRTILIGTF